MNINEAFSSGIKWLPRCQAPATAVFAGINAIQLSYCLLIPQSAILHESGSCDASHEPPELGQTIPRLRVDPNFGLVDVAAFTKDPCAWADRCSVSDIGFLHDTILQFFNMTIQEKNV